MCVWIKDVEDPTICFFLFQTCRIDGRSRRGKKQKKSNYLMVYCQPTQTIAIYLSSRPGFLVQLLPPPPTDDDDEDEVGVYDVIMSFQGDVETVVLRNW